jgi:hypothetical protein
MDSGHAGKFTVDRFQHVDGQIGALGKRALARGLLQDYADALETILDKLEAEPAEWGEPYYHPHHQGSTVRHASVRSVFVEYVVFEEERVVMIMQIKAMPSSDLD